MSTLLDVGLLKIFSQSVDCCFEILTVSLALEKLCNFMSSHLSILDLRAGAIGVLFKNFSLWLCIWSSSPLTFLLDSLLLVLCGDFWSTWTWALYKDKRMDQFAYFYAWTTFEPATFVENAVFFSNAWFYLLCQWWSDHKCVGSLVDIQLHSNHITCCFFNGDSYHTL